MKRNLYLLNGIVFVLLTFSCVSEFSNKRKNAPEYKIGTYGYDLNFLNEEGVDVLELISDDSSGRVLLVPEWQGRVMTSSSKGLKGRSNGWINYDLIRSGEMLEQFNPYGGEERFWLGPEGGPFSLYFSKGEEQIYQNWKVPGFLDTRPFEIKSQTAIEVVFTGQEDLINAAGNTLKIDVRRKVKLLSQQEVESLANIKAMKDLQYIAYQSVNTVFNKGENAWTEDYGFLSVWMLSMFNPSTEGVVVIPVKADEKSREEILVDDYFGKVPDDRLKLVNEVVFFKVDGKLRSKIGIRPSSARSVAGGYDALRNILTVVSYSGPEPSKPYVNSVWGEQDDPLEGDVINAYNDGPVDGNVMGPFYEIETSSRAAMLEPGDSITHIQNVYHFKGNEVSLDRIAKSVLGVSIHEMKKVFEPDPKP